VELHPLAHADRPADPQSAPALRPVGAVVRSTHENWDGTGCPSDRPYRAARSPEDAICELRRCAGQQFDPNVVDLLCEVLAAEEEPAAKLAARG